MRNPRRLSIDFLSFSEKRFAEAYIARVLRRLRQRTYCHQVNRFFYRFPEFLVESAECKAAQSRTLRIDEQVYIAVLSCFASRIRAKDIYRAKMILFGNRPYSGPDVLEGIYHIKTSAHLLNVQQDCTFICTMNASGIPLLPPKSGKLTAVSTRSAEEASQALIPNPKN